ncbi:hypothetical protein [Saccharopolyspora erythraea]|uniref:hypothetical protein n=1 Tax=Saccharopolyspora erythraea TaxID=1836 RepID=UPI00038CB5DB|nr:hypothetical protein [Saccharopolyspora erythraea]EQD86787.1 hypothetical protein N599_07985 [Saccharopolyspora erythraea D]QRK91026.1 hypothetical protein JQX30_06170 [Saccharopolyspora erythraea]
MCRAGGRRCPGQNRRHVETARKAVTRARRRLATTQATGTREQIAEAEAKLDVARQRLADARAHEAQHKAESGPEQVTRTVAPAEDRGRDAEGGATAAASSAPPETPPRERGAALTVPGFTFGRFQPPRGLYSSQGGIRRGDGRELDTEDLAEVRAAIFKAASLEDALAADYRADPDATEEDLRNAERCEQKAAQMRREADEIALADEPEAPQERATRTTHAAPTGYRIGQTLPSHSGPLHLGSGQQINVTGPYTPPASEQPRPPRGRDTTGRSTNITIIHHHQGPLTTGDDTDA